MPTNPTVPGILPGEPAPGGHGKPGNEKQRFPKPFPRPLPRPFPWGNDIAGWLARFNLSANGWHKNKSNINYVNAPAPTYNPGQPTESTIQGGGGGPTIYTPTNTNTGKGAPGTGKAAKAGPTPTNYNNLGKGNKGTKK